MSVDKRGNKFVKIDAKKWFYLKKISNSYSLDPSLDEAKRATRVCRTSTSRLTQLAFDQTGGRLLVVDSEGLVTIVELGQCMRYRKIGTVRSCTFLGFGPTKKNEVLVGSVDGSIKIINIGEDSKEFCSLNGHKYPVKHVSSYKGYTSTSSLKEVIIWDLATCTKVHQLRFLTSGVSLRKASFSSTGSIAVLYKDSSLQVWELEKLERDVKIDTKSFGLRDARDYEFTKDGRAMVLAGIPNVVLVLNTFNWDLIKRLELPDGLTSVRALGLLPQPLDGGANKILAILSADRTLRFVDLSTSQFVPLSSNEIIAGASRFCVSPNGRYVAYIDVTGSLRLEVADTLLSLVPKLKEKVEARNRPRSHGTEDHLRCVRQYIKEELNLERLIPILKEFGEYPSKHRTLIWTSILELPRNRSAYAGLSNKPPQQGLTERILAEYPLDDRSRASFLATIVNSLVHWCPMLSQSTYVPRLIFPFLVVFQGNHVLAFETIIFLFLNYCQRWFEYHPLPPLNVLAALENVLSEADPLLLNFFCEKGVISSEYIWPLLQTMMSEVFSGDEWLLLWDHLFSSGRPSLLLMCSLAYSICSREVIMSQLRSADDFAQFYHAQGHVRVNDLLKVAQRLDNNTPYHLHPARYFRNRFHRLPKTGLYPSFLSEQYPKFITEDSHLELQRLQLQDDQATILRHDERCKLKANEEKRLRMERENFLREIDAARVNELRRCYEAKIFSDESNFKKIYQQKVSSKHSTCDATRDLRKNITDETLEGDWQAKNCQTLQDQVRKLEFEVQTLLKTIDSSASTKITVCK